MLSETLSQGGKSHLRPTGFITKSSWIVLLSALIAAEPAQSQNRRAPLEKGWVDYGGGADGSHYSPLNAINKSNVNQLEMAWNYPQGSAGFNPIVAGNMIY